MPMIAPHPAKYVCTYVPLVQTTCLTKQLLHTVLQWTTSRAPRHLRGRCCPSPRKISRLLSLQPDDRLGGKRRLMRPIACHRYHPRRLLFGHGSVFQKLREVPRPNPTSFVIEDIVVMVWLFPPRCMARPEEKHCNEEKVRRRSDFRRPFSHLMRGDCGDEGLRIAVATCRCGKDRDYGITCLVLVFSAKRRSMSQHSRSRRCRR